jgi:hypothetical protein
MLLLVPKNSTKRFTAENTKEVPNGAATSFKESP